MKAEGAFMKGAFEERARESSLLSLSLLSVLETTTSCLSYSSGFQTHCCSGGIQSKSCRTQKIIQSQGGWGSQASFTLDVLALHRAALEPSPKQLPALPLVYPMLQKNVADLKHLCRGILFHHNPGIGAMDWILTKAQRCNSMLEH